MWDFSAARASFFSVHAMSASRASIFAAAASSAAAICTSCLSRSATCACQCSGGCHLGTKVLDLLLCRAQRISKHFQLPQQMPWLQQLAAAQRALLVAVAVAAQPLLAGAAAAHSLADACCCFYTSAGPSLQLSQSPEFLEMLSPGSAVSHALFLGPGECIWWKDFHWMVVLKRSLLSNFDTCLQCSWSVCKARICQLLLNFEHNSFPNDLNTRFAPSHLHLSAKFERNWTWNFYLPTYPCGQA